MAHKLDKTLGRDAIAYAGDTPWHKLGARLEPTDSIDVWTEAAGLNWHAREGQVFAQIGEQQLALAGYKALVRSDTNDALSIVSAGYRVVQPDEVMQFFGTLVKTGGFQMESAGALFGGRKIWALAKIHDGAPVFGDDVVQPYLLLATSFDGSMATTARLTSVRVVCNNTLNASEQDTGTVVRVNHGQSFDASKTRMDLGVYVDQFERMMLEARRMAVRNLYAGTAQKVAEEIFSHVLPRESTVEDIRQYAGYQRVMQLFNGSAIGADMAGQTAWGLLNAFTQYVDHERGRGDERRFGSAMMGAGDRLKQLARARIAELV